MDKIYQSLQTRNILHFFVENCNIFPAHKVTNKNILEYTNIFQNMPKLLGETIENLLRQDLGIPTDEMRLNLAMVKLEITHHTGLEAYIAGYLTRLLSVITFSLTENYEESHELGKASWEEMKEYLPSTITTNMLAESYVWLIPVSVVSTQALESFVQGLLLLGDL